MTDSCSTYTDPFSHTNHSPSQQIENQYVNHDDVIMNEPINEPINEYHEYKQYLNFWSGGQYSKCLPIITKLLTNYPYNPIYHLRYAQYLYQQQSVGDNQIVITIKECINKSLDLAQFCEFSFELIDIHRFASTFYQQMENNPDAVKYHNKVAWSIYNDPQSHYKDARRLIEIAEYEKAEYHLKKCIELSKENNTWMSPYFMYYQLLLKQERIKEAKQQIEIVLKYRQDNDYILHEYGVFIIKYEENYKFGLQCINYAIKLKPNNQIYQESYNYYYQKEKQVKLEKKQQEMNRKNKEENDDDDKSDIDICNDSSSTNGSLSNASCSNEFKRFLLKHVFQDENTANIYYQKFKKVKLNNILVLSQFNEKMLKHTIQINNKGEREHLITQTRNYLNNCQKVC